MGKIADLPFGWVGTYDDNEIEIVSTIADPPKIRLAIPNDKVESNLGAVSFNLRRSDGRHEEYGYVMGRLTPGKSAGAIYLAVRPDGQQDCREVFYIDGNGANFRVPVSMPNGGGGQFPHTIALRSRANNRLLCVDMAQLDGRGEPKTVANRDAIGEWEMFDVIVVE